MRNKIIINYIFLKLGVHLGLRFERFPTVNIRGVFQLLPYAHYNYYHCVNLNDTINILLTTFYVRTMKLPIIQLH